MNKQISKLHFITQDLQELSHPELVLRVCRAGIDWVQLRIKNRSREEKLLIAKQALDTCREYRARLIINDDVMVAKEIGADGVHLGKTDMDPVEARKILGTEIIVGGTANTFDDILRLKDAGVDYIGLGPYRFTTTKENLSPILGIEGYKSIMRQCVGNGVGIPVIAIGGIKAEDVGPLKATGVYGVAVSSAISLSRMIPDSVKHFQNEFQK